MFINKPGRTVPRDQEEFEDFSPMSPFAQEGYKETPRADIMKREIRDLQSKLRSE